MLVRIPPGVVPAGAWVVEARPFLFVPSLGKWSCFYSELFALDDVIHHYALQLGLNETIGAAEAIARRGRTSAWETWTMDALLPQAMLERTLSIILEVGGDAGRYRAAREARRTISWAPGASNRSHAKCEEHGTVCATRDGTPA